MADKKSNTDLDFIYVGTARSGSTWLYECLREHPEICVSDKKELGIFTKSYQINSQLFSDNFSHCRKEQIRGVLPPGYILDKNISKKLKKIYPDIKVIMFLRNPVDRFWSQLVSLKKGGRIPWSAGVHEVINESEDFYKLGLYHEVLEEYKSVFSERNIYIGIYEDIFKDSEKAISDIYKFLNVDPAFVPSSANKIVFSSQAKLRKSLILAKILLAIKNMVSIFKAQNKTTTNVVNALNKFLKIDYIFMKIENINKIKPTECVPHPQDLQIDLENKKMLFNMYENSILKTENILKKNLSHWKV